MPLIPIHDFMPMLPPSMRGDPQSVQDAAADRGANVPDLADGGDLQDLFRVLPEGERLMMDSIRDMLSGDRFREFALRHTKYSHKERFLHVISFGHKYSEARKAHHLEKRQAAEFSRAMIQLQTKLAALPKGEAGSVRIDAGGVSLRIEQDASGALRAAVAPSDEIDLRDTYEIPLNARALSRKMLSDILQNPKDYGKHALLNELEVIRNPETHRGVFEAVLAETCDISPDDVGKVGARTLRDAALEALRGGFHSRKHVLGRLNRALNNTAELQDALKLSDEQSRELTDRLADAMQSDALHVERSVDISRLTAVPEAGRTPEQIRNDARNTRIHNFFADLTVNRDSTVHDRNTDTPGERLRETMLDHAGTVVELLNGDASLLDTLGDEIAEHMKPQLDRLRPFWEMGRGITGGTDREKIEGLLSILPPAVLAAAESQIDAAVDEVCSQISGQIRLFLDEAAEPEPLLSAQKIIQKHADNRPKMALDLLRSYREPLTAFADASTKVNKKLRNELMSAKSPFLRSSAPVNVIFSCFMFVLPEALKSDDSLRTALETLARAGKARNQQAANPNPNTPEAAKPAAAPQTLWGVPLTKLEAVMDALEQLDQQLQSDDGQKRIATMLERIRGVFEQYRPLEDIAKESVSTDKGYMQLVRRVMIHYFDSHPEDSVVADAADDGGVHHDAIDRQSLDNRAVDRRSMVASLIRYTRNGPDGEASAGEKLGALFKGAGPIMQKALQGMDAGALDPEFAKAIEDMKSSLAPIEPKYVQAQLLDIVSRSGGAIRKITVDRSLGAASVGQAFLCTVTDSDGNERSCVLKLLRPDVRNKATREKALFEHYAKQIPGMETTFAGQLERILSELDLRTEAANADIGKIYNDKPETDAHGVEIPPRVRSMEVMADVAPTENALLLERAKGSDLATVMRESGEAFDRIRNLAKDNRLDAASLLELRNLADDLRDTHDRLCTLSRRWVDEGIFGHGFYHGDLHAGNIMIDLPDRTQPVPAGGEKPEVGAMTVIDYGNATTLTKSQQKHVMVVMAGATFNRADWFKEGYLKLLPKNEQENFKARDTLNVDADGFLLDERNRRVFDENGRGIRVSPNGNLLDAEGNTTRKKAPGRLTAMLEDVMHRGEMHEAAFRIAIPMTRLQEAGVACPAPIFNFSACQIRLQNAVDSLAARVDEMYGFLRKEGMPIADEVLMNPGLTGENDDARLHEISQIAEATKEIPEGKRNVFFQEMGTILGDRVRAFVGGIGLTKGLEIRSILNRQEE